MFHVEQLDFERRKSRHKLAAELSAAQCRRIRAEGIAISAILWAMLICASLPFLLLFISR